MSVTAPIALLCRATARYLADHEPWPEAAAACASLNGAVFAEIASPPAPIALQLSHVVTSAPLPAMALRDALIVAASELHWRQNANYRDAEFLSRYAYTELLGPNGLLPNDSLSLGVLYLAPHTLYPEHAHPAEEAYHVIAGSAEWRAGDADWTLRTPGSRILHGSAVPHAMRTSNEPLLALYLWRGEIATPATWHVSTPPPTPAAR